MSITWKIAWEIKKKASRSAKNQKQLCQSNLANQTSIIIYEVELTSQAYRNLRKEKSQITLIKQDFERKNRIFEESWLKRNKVKERANPINKSKSQAFSIAKSNLLKKHPARPIEAKRIHEGVPTSLSLKRTKEEIKKAGFRYLRAIAIKLNLLELN